jgi:hypothetical protein
MLAIAAFVLASLLFGQPEANEKPDPRSYATLEAIPEVSPPASPPLTAEEAARIRKLIDELASIDRPDFGLSPTTFGSAFAALPELTRFQGGIIQIDHRHHTTSPFVELVKLGPKAMPFLLEALDDKRPTKLEMKHNRGFGSMWSAREIGANPMNEHQWAALKKHPPTDVLGHGNNLKAHTVTIGDVCFAIVGQITGSGYSAVRYQPTACIVINSPTLDPEISAFVRECWASPDPSRKLFDSLLIDFCTRGKHQGEFLDHWSYGSRFQVSAATRLLYYFPELSAPIIAQRLDALDVNDLNDDDMDAYVKQCVANGVRSMDLIEAVSWSDRPEVRQSMAAMMQRTTNPEIFLECLRVTKEPDRAKAADRILEYIAKLPADEGAPFGRGYHLLQALVKVDADRARPVYEEFVKGCMHRRRTVCHAVQETKPAWGCEVLLPLLDDKQNADWWNYGVVPGQDEPRLPIRVSDEAADAINAIRPEFNFAMQGTHAELDAAEAKMKQSLEAKRGRD